MAMNNITDDWRVVFTSHSIIEINGAKNYLESEGITVFSINEMAGQIYGNAVDQPKILVRESEFEKAVLILQGGGYIKD